MYEYTQSMVGRTGCDYSDLNKTYTFASGDVPMGSGEYIVPAYCPGNGANAPAYPPPYDTLTHNGRFGCGSHFSLKDAYPYYDCTSCKTTFMKRKCDSCDIAQGCAPAAETKSKEGFFSGWF